MADHDKNAQKAPKKTVLAASGAYHEQASDNAPPGSREEPVAGLLGVADTFVAPRGVDASGRPITAPPASSHATVLGASGAAAAKQGARLAITAPEIGSLAGGMTACVPDLPDRDPSALVGSVVADRYRILKLLGQGGMGVVYLAEHVVIEKRVALKVLNEELTHSRDAVSRFIYEAKAASKIGHENIIDINDFGTTPEGGVFFVMEFLDGSDLADLLKDQGRIGWEECRSIGLQACRALAAAHSKGIIHRDLKPENIFLICQGGRPDFVKILDFGIAKFTGMEGGAPKQTKTGMIFGTPDYMAPEQAEARNADHRVDIYSLGIILYQLVTGRLPFEAETFMGVLHQHMTKIPTPPRELEPSLPVAFDAIIRKTLEKDPDKRYQTMQELGAALEALSTGEILPEKPSAPTDLAAEPRRSPPLPDTARVPPLGAPEARKLRGKGKAPLLVLALALVGIASIVGLVLFFMGSFKTKETTRQKQDLGGQTTPGPVVENRADAQVPRIQADAMAPAEPMVPERTVKLEVLTRPDGVEVLLDGDSIGRTPIQDYRVPLGETERVLLLKKDGYRSLEIKFTPDSNQSWDRTLVRGRGLIRVAPDRPRPMELPMSMDETMTPGPMEESMRPPTMDQRPVPRDGMAPMESDLKDPDL